MLLEREVDAAVLAGWWERAAGGNGGLVVVSGEPGAGKTSMVQRFVEQGAAGASVLWGACDPLATPRPLGPLHDIAGALGERAATLLQGAPALHEVCAAVLEQLRRAPCVLVVDDLHWADQGTVDLLRFLLRRIGTTPSLVVTALREEEVGPMHPARALLGDAARAPDATRVALRPLSVEAVATLAIDRPIDPVRLHEATGGNPFFVLEMLRYEGDSLPTSVRDAILARAAGLDAPTWELLHLLVCAPQAISDRVLARLGVGLPALRALDAAGLIRRSARGVAFRHDLCRLAVASTIPPGGEASIHARMLEVLEASGGAAPLDHAVLAHHAAGAGDRAAIVRHAPAAGRVAARMGAHAQAAALFALALEQGGGFDAADEAELLELLAVECYVLDRLEEAIAASDRALRLRGSAGELPGVSYNHHSMSMYEWYNGDRRAAERHAVAAVAVLEDGEAPDTPQARATLGHALAMNAYLALQASDLERARRLVSEAAAVGDVDDPVLSVRTGLIDRICDLAAGDLAARAATLEILDRPTRTFDEALSSGFSNLSYLDVEQRRLRDAATTLARSLPLTLEWDLPICRVWQLGARARLQLLGGDWPAAVTDAVQVLEAPSAPLTRTWPHLVRGLVALRRGVDADADLEEGWHLATRLDEPIRVLPAAAALAERAWLLGVDDGRFERWTAMLDEPGEGLAWAKGELAVWLRRLADDAAARGCTLRWTPPSLADVAEPFRLQLTGRHLEAAALWAQLGAPYEQALALLDAAHPEQSRVALDLLDRLGADAVAASARRRLRAAGVASIPARRRTTTRANAAGLTDRQLDVLRLLADGLSNAELADALYISAKTVDHHVSAILAKLQVTGRRAAIAAARERGILA